MVVNDMANDIIKDEITPGKLAIVFLPEEVVNTLICFRRKRPNWFTIKIAMMVQIREDACRPRRAAVVFFQFPARGTSILLQSLSEIH
jgi:hypothetical protein